MCGVFQPKNSRGSVVFWKKTGVQEPTHKSLEKTKGAINPPTGTWSLAQLPIT